MLTLKARRRFSSLFWRPESELDRKPYYAYFEGNLFEIKLQSSRSALYVLWRKRTGIF
jgi:hypothetical protein